MTALDEAGDDIRVQMMLAWTLANRLRSAWGGNVGIFHWALQMYHGLCVVDLDDRDVSVVIEYQASIHLQPGSGEFPVLPNARHALLGLVPPREIVDQILSLLRPGDPRGSAGSSEVAGPTERAAVWDVAYKLVEAMLRLSLQRGYGWRCDSPDDEGWGLFPHLVIPYQSHTSVDLSDLKSRTYYAGYPEFSGQLADWSFIAGPAGPVCAIDPNVAVMFPGGKSWPLAALVGQPAWKVAAAIAARAGAKPSPQHRRRLSLTHAIAGEIPMHELLAHDAGGGRIVDHHLYGPLPVLKAGARSDLSRASGGKIPPNALAWPRPSSQLLADAQSAALPKLAQRDEFPPDVIGLLIAWTKPSGPSDVAVVVVAPEAATATGYGLLPGLTQHVEVKVVGADMARDHASDVGWRLNVEESTVLG
jgi:hypothetical protein